MIYFLPWKIGLVDVLGVIGTGLVVNCLGIDLSIRRDFDYQLEDSLDRAYAVGLFLWLVVLGMWAPKGSARLWWYGTQAAWLVVIIALKLSGKNNSRVYKVLVRGLLSFVVLEKVLID